MRTSNRMVINTFVMYARLVISMIITLLSSRWILLALGTEDFGIYNLVAVILSMLMFLNLTMATASQRFMSFALGKKDENLIRDTFYYSCILHFLVGLIILLFIEVIGGMMLNTFLKVPEGKLHLAFFCLHTLSISTFFTVISVPYRAALISHENIIFVSIVELSTAILKLLGAIFLLYYLGNRLKMYAIIMATISLLTMIVFRIYCHINYQETKLQFRKINDFTLFTKITSYAGWNLIGSIGSLLRTQGISLLLNSFYGVAMNAAYGISSQVKGQLSHISQSIFTATRPQIVKSEGMGNRSRVHSLSAFTCKTSFLLFGMICAPLIVEMPYILKLWLKNVPEYSIIFTQLILIICLIHQIGAGISVAIESVGNIKTLQIVIGGLHFVVLPIAFFMLWQGMEPYSIFIMVCIEEAIAVVMRLYISKKNTGLEVLLFIRKTLLPSVITIISLFLLMLFVKPLLTNNFIRLVLMSFLSLTFITVVGYFYTLTQFEREHVNNIIIGIKNKIHRIKS